MLTVYIDTYPYYHNQGGYDQMHGFYSNYMPSPYQKSYSQTASNPDYISLPSSLSQPTTGGDYAAMSHPSKPHSKKENNILIASGFPTNVTPYKIFRLFSLYGNVTKVKIMFKKRDTALIQYMDSYQAKLAKLYLNGCQFGDTDTYIKVNTSKSQYIIMPKKGAANETEESMLAQDFSHSKEHRYKIAGSRNFQNIAPPSKVLHLSNLPKNISEEGLQELFSPIAEFSKIKFFEVGGKTMAHAEFDSVSTAIEVIVTFHNYNIEGRYLKLSFSKNVQDGAQAEAELPPF